ncbi:ABC transporter ATP-binding protein [Clostridium niameyense]|uniref:ABC transporter ATP-binding protein n=1 Tax=Clostridium niameyense TaxID=1622073 RepID=A0A6M0RA44_9CLOT|nr:ABC transporter ATP-binding protein [Clostridium niameyense]
MIDYALQSINLSKKFKKECAVDNVNLNIKKGEIYGFIGENGAGKTTFIRMVTGLIKPNDGEIEIFGVNAEKNLSVRKRIGALIETPAFYPDMTAFQNLEACRIQKGIPGIECTEKILKALNLYNNKDKKVKNFSLGMKQKLGLATALLGDPEFLILDEPINGLDPIGIIEVRDILKKLNKDRDTTILISSHILEELNNLATCYGIIHKGKFLQEITAAELHEKCKQSLNIKVDNVAKAVVILEEKLNTKNYKVLSDETIRLYDYIENAKLVSSTLTKSNVIIEELICKGDSLEEYFINLIGGVDKNV